MKGSRKIKVLFSTVFIILIAFSTLSYIHFYQTDAGEETQEDVLGVRNITGVPYIISLPPIVAVQGELYQYRVRVTDRDTDLENLTLEYVSGPEWLELEGQVLEGIAPEESVGSYKIVLRVSDGYNSSTQEEYILVE